MRLEGVQDSLDRITRRCGLRSRARLCGRKAKSEQECDAKLRLRARIVFLRLTCSIDRSRSDGTMYQDPHCSDVLSEHRIGVRRLLGDFLNHVPVLDNLAVV